MCKISVSTIVFCVLCASAAADSTPPKAEAIQRKVIVGDLMDERFAILEAYLSHERRLSGWDLQPAGGKYDYYFFEWFKITDTNDSAPFIMKKRFVEQTAGKITLEYKFRLPFKMDGAAWQLRSGSTPAVAILTDNGNLCYKDAAQKNISLLAYNADQEYAVKLIADIDASTTDIYIDGNLLAKGATFTHPAKSLDSIYIQTSAPATGDMYLGPIYIYKGYAVRERFIMPAGSVPSDWKISAKDGSVSVRQLRGAKTEMDRNSLRFDDTAASSNVSASRNFASMPGKTVFMCQFMLPEKVDGIRMLLRNGNKDIVEFTTSGGAFCYVDPKGKTIPIWKKYRNNLWYDLKIVASPDTGKADFYINTMQKASSVDCRAKASKGIDNICFETSIKGTGVLWLDDVEVYPYQDYPPDYVPEPVVVKTGDYMIGVQSCDIWREGSHTGWDFVKDFADKRKPYLGWYNGGDTEVADWYIKWMAENGISFEYKCWYRRAKGFPIHTPLGSEAIYGLRYARWSNKFKYAINFTNHEPLGVSDMNDWKQNVVPYLIEHYFVDPRYYKIDNKPLFGIHEPHRLNTETGDIVEALRYLKAECRKAGLDGIVLLGMYWNNDENIFADFKKWGFEAVYSYSWFTYEPNSVEVQKAKMNTQKGRGVIDILPTLSMGWDPRGCGGKQGYFVTAAEFQTLAKWAKDEFMPSYPAGSLARRLVMVDNWNEYGEGHFIMPSTGQGFGYVNALREVFGNGQFPPNTMPTPGQKARLDTLYPKGDW